MNCEEANQIDMVDLRCSERKKNVWYDHGAGIGGKVVNLTMEYYSCNMTVALQKIAAFEHHNFLHNTFKGFSFHLHDNLTVAKSNAAKTT